MHINRDCENDYACDFNRKRPTTDKTRPFSIFKTYLYYFIAVLKKIYSHENSVSFSDNQTNKSHSLYCLA